MIDLSTCNYAITIDHDFSSKFVSGICCFAHSKAEAFLLKERVKEVLKVKNPRWNKSRHEYLRIHKISDQLRPQWQKSIEVRALNIRDEDCDKYLRKVIKSMGYWPVSLYADSHALYNEEIVKFDIELNC
jgi:hypothetical protein